MGSLYLHRPEDCEGFVSVRPSFGFQGMTATIQNLRLRNWLDANSRRKIDLVGDSPWSYEGVLTIIDENGKKYSAEGGTVQAAADLLMDSMVGG